jgi:type I restriction enzyme M protein
VPHDNDQPAEKVLFDAANALRGSVESATYKHLVLGLVFLKYVSDGFQARRIQLDALSRAPGGDWYAADDEDRVELLEDRDAYEVENVFWVPPEARWDALLALGSQPDLGVQLDQALDLIERENPALKDVLPKIYAGVALSSETLGKLVSTIAKIGFGSDPDKARDVLGRVYEYFIKELHAVEDDRVAARVLDRRRAPSSARTSKPSSSSLIARNHRRRRRRAIGNDLVTAVGARAGEPSAVVEQRPSGVWGFQ